MYDLIIVGGRPARLTPALYAQPANKTLLVIEKATFGGQITFSPKVENIPGFLSVSGNAFAEKLVEQVLEQGADMEMSEVIALRDGAVKTVVTDSGEFEGKAVVIATGAKHRLLGLPKEEQFIGEGISFCAVCDGAFYKDKTVAVIGGGNSALQEALLLSELAKEVYIVQNLDFLTGEDRLCQQVNERANIRLLLGTTVSAFLGEDTLTGIAVVSAATGTRQDIPLDGVFVAVGLVPQNEPFAALLTLDARGYAKADETCTTGCDGVFVAGDCRTKEVRQVATAIADGAVAALAACRYLDT